VGERSEQFRVGLTFVPDTTNIKLVGSLMRVSFKLNLEDAPHARQ